MFVREREQESVLSPRERVRERADLGGLEDKRVGRYAGIGEQSSQSFLCPPLAGGPKSMISRRGLNNWSPNALASYRLKQSKPHPYPLFHTLQQYLLNFKVFEQVFYKERESNFPKRTYSPLDLLTYSIKKQAAFTLAEDVTRVVLPNRQCRVAFTLAEVLITLGIIGVVAAMTLPTIVTKYKRQTAENKLKKFYSVMNQAVQMSIAEHGEIPIDNQNRESANNSDYITMWYKEYITKYIKTNP